MIRWLGNSSSPRWYELDLDLLPEYIAVQQAGGANSTEIVLHNGSFDERTARVHVVRNDWTTVIQAYRDADMDVQVHASLTPEFSVNRWNVDRHGLIEQYGAIIDQVSEISQDQKRLIFVVHGATGRGASLEQNDHTTVEFLTWLSSELGSRSENTGIALELRAYSDFRPTATGTSRGSLLDVIHAVGKENVGICWDLAHDFENGLIDPSWTAIPDERFLDRVIHSHVHDVDNAGEPHFPLTLGSVPFELQLGELRGRNCESATLEIRWRCAMRLGNPWDMLSATYDVMNRSGVVASNFQR